LKVDPRNLQVADAVRLLNSTSLGEVVQPHTVYRHLNRAGYRIGDRKKIDLLRYAAWLFHARSEQGWGDGNYEQYRDDANARSRQVSESTRDIASEGWVHEPKDADRKQRCSNSFRLFCETYFHQTFHMAWSPDHLKVIGKIELAVLQGGLFAMAMPRGSGKTSLCEVACLWSLLYGHRDFIALIGSDEEHAEEMLESIKSELENNALIEEDFSEVAGPIRALEGIHQRAAGQLYQTHRTHIEWTSKEIVLPTIPNSRASAGIIKVTGITGRIRGMKYKRPDGRSVRPSLVLLDDPQTDESARSPAQCAAREQILAGAILGLAGPGKEDRRADDANGGAARRHGGPSLGPRQAPAVAGRADQDALQPAQQRETLGAVRRDPGQLPEERPRHWGSDRVLSEAQVRHGSWHGGGLAGAPPSGRAVGSPARDEPATRSRRRRLPRRASE
jgi:hypothetical protein